MRLRLLLLLLPLGALACVGPPQPAPYAPRPQDALAAARAKAEAAPSPELEGPLRRAILQRCLTLGWTQEAAQEYLRLEHLRRGDPKLLRELCLATLRWALRDLDPARRQAALRVAGQARELPEEERLALAEIGVRDARPLVRAEALRVLAALSLPRARPLLRAGLEDRAGVARLAALQGLSREGDPEASAAFARAAQDPEPALRIALCELLGARSLVPETQALLSELIPHGDLATARAAALALARHRPEEALLRWEGAHAGALSHAGFAAGLTWRARGSGQLPRLLSSELPAAACLDALAPLEGAARERLAPLTEALEALVLEHPAPAVKACALRLLGEARSSRLEHALAELQRSPDLRLRRLALAERARVSLRELREDLQEPGLADLAAARLERLLPREEWRELLKEGLRGPAREGLLPLALTCEDRRERALALLSQDRPRLRSLALQTLLDSAQVEDLALLLPHLTQDRDEDLLAAAVSLTLLRRSQAQPSGLPQ